MKHQKPTKDELKEGIEEVIQETEKEEADGDKELEKVVEEVESTGTSVEATEKTEETEETEEDHQEDKKDIKLIQENEKETEETEERPTQDYKKKFIESTREAQVLYAKNKKLNEAIENTTKIAAPTDDELKETYPDWEVMSDFERKMAKDSLINKRRFAALAEVTKDFKDYDRWQKKVNEFVTDEVNLTKYPELDGRSDEFKLFASKPTRRGVSFGDLVAAFAYTESKSRPAKKKGKMFETGSKGDKNIKKRSNKLSIEQGRRLRLKDYSKWKQLLKAGKIESVV